MDDSSTGESWVTAASAVAPLDSVMASHKGGRFSSWVGVSHNMLCLLLPGSVFLEKPHGPTG